MNCELHQTNTHPSILIISQRLILDYSRVEANPPHPNIKVEAVAHEAVVYYREPSQPNPGYNEGFVVRSAGRLGRRP